jgi:hypothetical protein
LEPVICYKKRRWQDHSRCPLCNTENEKNITRPPLSKQIIKRKLQKNLEEDLTPTLESNMTAPSLKKALLLILQKWREGKTIKPSDHPQIFGIREAVRDQSNHLGWNNFVYTNKKQINIETLGHSHHSQITTYSLEPVAVSKQNSTQR